MSLRGALLSLGIVAGCTGAGAERSTPQAAQVADTARPWHQPGDKIDSILPMAEYLRRFREGLPEPGGLQGGDVSREALARRFLAGVAQQDTAVLVDLLVSRAEFGWLIFPQHVYSEPPYDLDPAIFWLQIRAGSNRGLGRTLGRYGGHPLAFVALHCQRDTRELRPGPTRMWSSCGLRYRDGALEEERRLFGSIVERDGRAKLLSFANDF